MTSGDSNLPDSPYVRPLDYDPYATQDLDGYEEPAPDEDAFYDPGPAPMHPYDPQARTDDPIGDYAEEIYEQAVRDGHINPRRQRPHR